MTCWISLKGVGKEYNGNGVATKALYPLDLELEAGRITAIVGPSGSGKSTLLSLIGSLDTPTSGEIYFNDLNINRLRGSKLADFRFRRIGFVFQHFHLLPTLTALENIMVPLFAYKVPYKRRQKAMDMLEQVGLADKKNALPSQLSGGEQQRVAIARALIGNPSWLLADEPTGNLDSENGSLVFELLQSHARQMDGGLLLVTHDPEMAARADRVLEMKDGRLKSDSHKTSRQQEWHSPANDEITDSAPLPAPARS